MFLSTKELAEKWNVDQSRVLRLAREGRIDGAILFGNNWLFPLDAKKPADGRTKAVKESNKGNVLFRFPIYLNFDESSYNPPLSDDEKLLKTAQEEFYKCNFHVAKKLLVPLSENENNIYIKLASLYFLCIIAKYENSQNFDSLLWEMNSTLSTDFPYKKEMMFLRYSFETDSGFYKTLLEEFKIDNQYSYHPSAYYSLILISILPIENGDFSLLSKLRYDTYELICQQMEREGYWFEAQKLHYLLLIVYQLQNNTEQMEYHTRKGLEIAYERKFYWIAADFERFYPVITHKVLKQFPEDFNKLIRKFGDYIQKKEEIFMHERNNESFLYALSNKDYEYAFLANQGYTNREIAKKLNVSEKYVSQCYKGIYEKLGVKSKQELVDLINNTHTTGKY